MRYRRLYVNTEHHFSVGHDEETGYDVIEIVITWVAWYSIYFRLMPQEMAAFELNPDSLVPLSYDLAKDKGFGVHRERLVFNEAPHRR
jgi:hypothetical protein